MCSRRLLLLCARAALTVSTRSRNRSSNTSPSSSGPTSSINNSLERRTPASLRPEEDGKFETYAGLVASNHDRTFEHRGTDGGVAGGPPMKWRELLTLLGGAAARPAGKVRRRRPDGGTFFCPPCGALYSVTCPRTFQDGQQRRKVRGLLANDG